MVEPVIDPEGLPEAVPGDTEGTRKKLLDRLKNFFTTPKEDDDLDNAGDNDMD